MKRFLLLALFLLLAGTGPAAEDLFDIKPVADGVYAAIAKPAYRVNCNAAIIARLNGELRSLLEMPDVRQRLADLSGVPTPSSPEEMRALVEREIARWKRVVELKNIERQN